MSDMPKVIYLHDGQTEITWSSSREVFGEEYIRADQIKITPMQRHELEIALDYLATGNGKFIKDSRVGECSDKIRKFIVEQSQ